MENREEIISNYKAFLRFQGVDNEKIIDTMCIAFERGYDLKNKQLLEEIERLKSKINNQNKLLSDLYLATCDFDVSLFYPEKVEDFDLASNKVWIYINENNLQ